MQPSKATLDLLCSLDAFSGHKLTRHDDLATLIEIAVSQSDYGILGQLSFFAKFISKTHDIMQRIGKEGDGYDRILKEFTETVTRVRGLLNKLLANAPQTTVDHFASTYQVMTHESLQHLLALCYDLSWYKNWLLDHPPYDRPRR